MRGHVWPNPPVGCVIVTEGVVVAEAATHPGGRPHAERKALEQAGAKARGATFYVTLEPCCHWGQTPPCAEAIIEAGVSRVVCAIQDPDPRVNGGGFAKLRNAGVELLIGVCAEEAEQLMSGFFHRVRHGVPELIFVEQTETAIPAGMDALMMSSSEGIRLSTRRGEALDEVLITGVPKPGLLVHLGEMGLTSVAVPRGDPIVRGLTGPGARASYGSRGWESNRPPAFHP